MAVCPTHHALITNHSINEDQQRQAKNDPVNIATGKAQGVLSVPTRSLEVHFGTNVAIATPWLVTMGATPVIGVRSEGGAILVTAPIHGRSGRKLGHILDNEWTFDPALVWDFQSKGRVVKARLANHQISLQVECDDDKVTLEGNWWFNKTSVQITKSAFIVGDRSFRGCTMACGFSVIGV